MGNRCGNWCGQDMLEFMLEFNFASQYPAGVNERPLQPS
jgi:hypothetical protein